MKSAEVFMDNYKNMYYVLFNTITNAIEAQASKNYELAIKILMTAQENTEEIFINE